MVMLLLPASSASSTYASCEDQSVGSIVFADHQVALGVEAAGHAVDAAIGKIDRHAPSGGVGRSLGEQAEDVVRGELGVGLDGGQEWIEQIVGIRLVAGHETERSSLEV